MAEPLYTTDCRNGHHGAKCGMTPCSCVCHANERHNPGARFTSECPPCHAKLAGKERYPCYCLPGEARCDDPYNWCDRVR